MSVLLESFNIIIPRNIIDEIYPGGSDTLIKDAGISPEFYDEDLVRLGAADSIEISEIIDQWTGRGLRDIRKRKGKRTWIDLCLIESSQGLTLPCKWIRVENGSAKYTG